MKHRNLGLAVSSAGNSSRAAGAGAGSLMTAIRKPAVVKALFIACSGRCQYVSTAFWPRKVVSLGLGEAVVVVAHGPIHGPGRTLGNGSHAVHPGIPGLSRIGAVPRLWDLLAGYHRGWRPVPQSGGRTNSRACTWCGPLPRWPCQPTAMATA
jgi:hypothetical protein